MKRLTLIIALFSGIHLSAQQELDSLFLAANEAYTAGDFEHAELLYGQLLQTGYESATLYYNLGNVSYRSNQIGFAILYYEKALKMDPSLDDAAKNLEYVQQFREDRFEDVPELFIRKWVRALMGIFSLHAWAIISLILFVLILSGMLFYSLSRSVALRKTGFFGSAVLLLIFIVSLSATHRANIQVVDPDRAIIIDPSVVIKSAPVNNSTDLFILHEGTDVSIEEEVGEWIEIMISDGRKGWLKSSAIETI